MKPAIVIFGIAGGLAALLGFALVIGSLIVLCIGVPVNPYGLAIAGAAGIYLFYRGGGAFKTAFGAELAVAEEDYRSIEERLDELERLKRRDMVTPEEYAAKRQEILKNL